MLAILGANCSKVTHSTIALGTMRLTDVDRRLPEWVKFFTEIQSIGIDTLHSSVEYESFPLLCSILSACHRSSNFTPFRHIVKIAEPSFDDAEFDADRLDAKIDAYCADLGTDMIADVQWMWRASLSDDALRITDFERQRSSIAAAVKKLKTAKKISRFFVFPYSVTFAQRAIEQDFVDGLIVYRNVEETEYDSVIERCGVLSKSCIIIRPFNAGAVFLQDRRSPPELLEYALNKSSIDQAIISSNSIEHLTSLVAARVAP